MRIGIYLAYAPSRKAISLRKEGLGRYLSFLLKGFVETGNRIVLVCPTWVLPAIQELCEEEGIDRNHIEVVASAAAPALYRIYYRITSRTRKTQKPRRRLEKALLNGIETAFDVLLGTKNMFALLAWMILGLAAGLILLPFALVLGIVGGLVLGAVHLLERFFGITSVKGYIKNFGKALLRERKNREKLRKIFSIEKLVERVRRENAKELIRKIGNMKQVPEIWYCPTAFWKEFNEIKGTKVLCAPDLLPVEFPGRFSEVGLAETTRLVSDTIQGSTYLVTYSAYVKRELLQKRFFKQAENIRVIPHAPNHMLEFIDLSSYFQRVPFKEDVNKYFAKKILMPGLIQKSVGQTEYLGTYDSSQLYAFGDVDYIFYPSQVRGNKNILNLVKAYHKLLRKENRQIKLYMTCNYNNDRALKEYILKNHLQYDVLCFSDVTIQQLSALYICATLVVNPTLYEGGFPFTFSEGMSVGTPSVMSKIPQVLDVVAGYDLEDYFFDSYNVNDIAEKIDKALKEREILLEREEKLYSELKKRTWKDVCRDYLEAFSYFGERDRNDRKVEE